MLRVSHELHTGRARRNPRSRENGCAQCHGESDAHIDDESWASGGEGTVPDKIYTPQKVNEFCMECHDGDTLTDANHASLAAEKSQKSRCTDCHGAHMLANRVTKWK